jgi:G2/mitotic-specific cyclin-B, other
MKSGIA